MRVSHPKKGQAVLTTLIVLFSLAFLVALRSATLVSGEFGRSSVLQTSQESFFSAESALEDVLYRSSRGFPVGTSETVVVHGESVPITVSASGGAVTVSATGTKPNSARAVSLTASQGQNAGFFYGIHAGSAGFSMASNSEVRGDVFSNASVAGGSNSRIVGNANAVGIVSSPRPTVTGTRANNVSAVPLPMIDIAYWKAQANANNDPHVGNLEYSGNSPVFLGPKKIEGNFVMESNSSVTLRGPVHVTGNFTLDSNSDVYLDESFGSQGTVFIVDGTITIRSNGDIHGTSASPKGYIVLASLASGAAVELNSNTTAAVLYAPNGSAHIDSNASAVSVAAEGISMDSNSSINYDPALSGAQFSGGASSGWTFTGWGER